MHRALKTTILATATVLAIGAAALPAAARSTVPFLGRAQSSSEDTCFSEWYGTVYNNGSCGTAQRTYIMPWITDYATTYNAIVNAYSPSCPASPLSCQAFGVDNIAVGLWYSPDTSLSVSGSSQNIYVSAYVPANGSGYVACKVGSGARLNMMNH